MALLSSGDYNLIEKSCVRDKKSMIFVKFTDSAQRALNDFFKNQVSVWFFISLIFVTYVSVIFVKRRNERCFLRDPTRLRRF